MIRLTHPMFWLVFIGSSPAMAIPIPTILEGYRKQAVEFKSNFKEFSADRGRAFYTQAHASKSGDISCASCHMNDPRNVGRTRAHKEIEPMAPSVNPNRFTDPAKIEKWFMRNCDDVLGRTCNPIEKGDFITYILSIK